MREQWDERTVLIFGCNCHSNSHAFRINAMLSDDEKYIQEIECAIVAPGDARSVFQRLKVCFNYLFKLKQFDISEVYLDTADIKKLKEGIDSFVKRLETK